MGIMGTNGQRPGRFTRTALSEINVTPLVDVMLVLLIIFMITSSVETVRVEQEMERLRQAQLEALEEQPMDQKVPIELPKTNAEKVNLQEERKLVLTLNTDLEFYLGAALIARCREVAPELGGLMRRRPRPIPEAGAGTALTPLERAYGKCLRVIEDKLLENEKLKQDKELYLRADRRLDYGLVLMAMSRIRKAGITRFGLIAEPELEGEAPAGKGSAP